MDPLKRISSPLKVPPNRSAFEAGQALQRLASEIQLATTPAQLEAVSQRLSALARELRSEGVQTVLTTNNFSALSMFIPFVGTERHRLEDVLTALFMDLGERRREVAAPSSVAGVPTGHAPGARPRSQHQPRGWGPPSEGGE